MKQITQERRSYYTEICSQCGAKSQAVLCIFICRSIRQLVYLLGIILVNIVWRILSLDLLLKIFVTAEMFEMLLTLQCTVWTLKVSQRRIYGVNWVGCQFKRRIFMSVIYVSFRRGPSPRFRVGVMTKFEISRFCEVFSRLLHLFSLNH